MTDVARYNQVAIGLHWVIAIAMIAMIGLGLLMEDFPDAMKGAAYNFHKALGITVLALSVFRLIWRLMNPPPALPSSMKPHEKLLAHAAHWGLYFLMFALPMSGWLLTSAARKYPIDFFGLGSVPFLPMPADIDTKATAEWFEEMHELFANGAILLVGLHIVAALKHQIIDKDSVLSRMMPVWVKAGARG